MERIEKMDDRFKETIEKRQKMTLGDVRFMDGRMMQVFIITRGWLKDKCIWKPAKGEPK